MFRVLPAIKHNVGHSKLHLKTSIEAKSVTHFDKFFLCTFYKTNQSSKLNAVENPRSAYSGIVRVTKIERVTQHKERKKKKRVREGDVENNR